MAVSKALRQALRWGDEEFEEIADSFLDHKVFTYVETLADLLSQHGAEVSRLDVDLSDSILAALRSEARAHARSVVSTFNKELDSFLDRNKALARPEMLSSYETWAEARADSKAEQIAITEAYTAAADATMAFYATNAGEAEPLFDFGGHGDDDPVCIVCRVLLDTSPHPMDRVLAVGSPHIGCRQDWHPSDDFDPAGLPEELKLPEEPAGIVGKDAYVNAHDNDHAAAAAALQALALSE